MGPVFSRKRIIALCYVHDLFVSSLQVKMDQLKRNLNGGLIMKDLGTARSSLGIELINNEDAAYLRQKGLVQRSPEDNKIEE